MRQRESRIMKRHIEYMDYDLSGELAPVCGDRGIVSLDGRNNLETQIQDGHNSNGYRRPVYPAFRIIEGERLFTAKPITDVIYTKGK